MLVQEKEEVKKIRVEDLPDFNISDYLDTPERVVAYLDVVLQEKDIELLKEAIVDIYNSPGMEKIVKKDEECRKRLFAIAKESTSSFFEVAGKACEALGFRLGVQPITT